MSEGQEVIVTDWRPATAVQRITTPDDLLSIALNQGADLDRLERLMELKRKHEETEARKAYAEAMAAFKAEPLTIVKDKGVSHKGGSYRHATLGNVVTVLAEALGRHGLYHAWSTKQEADVVHVRCTLTHRLGHSESVTMSGPLDNTGSKNGIQQFGSTVTYLQRYSLLSITGTATSDQDDSDGGAPVALDSDILAALTKAATVDELQAIKPRIGALEGDVKQACIAAYAKRLTELSAPV